MGKKIRKAYQPQQSRESPVSKSKFNAKVMNKKPWSEQQDDLVRNLVQKYGPQRWSFIARYVEGRLGKQCRQRWHNHLNPIINKGDWLFHEEWILFLAHNMFGNKWSQIAKLIHQRTDNTIKNHWNSTMKKRAREYEKLLREIIEGKNQGILKQSQVSICYVKTQRQLIENIFENKENILLEEKLSIFEKSVQKEIYQKQNLTTIVQNRILNTNINSKKTKKDQQFGNFSSMKKSEKKNNLRESLGSLIFQTPEKGKTIKNQFLFESERYFFQKIQQSPQPFQIQQMNLEEQISINFLSPSKFLTVSNKKSLE